MTQALKQSMVAYEKNRQQNMPRMGQQSHKYPLAKLTSSSLKLDSHSVSLKLMYLWQILEKLFTSSGFASVVRTDPLKQPSSISQYSMVRKDIAIIAKSKVIISWNFVKKFFRQELSDSRIAKPRTSWYWMMMETHGRDLTCSNTKGNLRNQNKYLRAIQKAKRRRKIIHIRCRDLQVGSLLGLTMCTQSTTSDQKTIKAAMKENYKVNRIINTNKWDTHGTNLQQQIVIMSRIFQSRALQVGNMDNVLFFYSSQMREVYVHNWTVIVADTSRGTKLKQAGSFIYKQVIPNTSKTSEVFSPATTPDSPHTIQTKRVSKKTSNRITKYFQFRWRKEGIPGWWLFPLTTNKRTRSTNPMWKILTVRRENQKKTSSTNTKELFSHIDLNMEVKLIPASKFLFTTATKQTRIIIPSCREALYLDRQVIKQTDVSMRQKTHMGVLSYWSMSKQKQMGISKQLGLNKVKGMSRNKLTTSPWPQCSLHVASVLFSDTLLLGISRLQLISEECFFCLF